MQPHHDYPAVDLMMPSGTPVFAITAGQVVRTTLFNANWWTAGCDGGNPPVGCATCGMGITIQADNGLRATYCHNSVLLVIGGDHVTVGPTHLKLRRHRTIRRTTPAPRAPLRRTATLPADARSGHLQQRSRPPPCRAAHRRLHLPAMSAMTPALIAELRDATAVIYAAACRAHTAETSAVTTAHSDTRRPSQRRHRRPSCVGLRLPGPSHLGRRTIRAPSSNHRPRPHGRPEYRGPIRRRRRTAQAVRRRDPSASSSR